MAELKITVLEADQVEYWDEETDTMVINHKAKYYFVNALGQYIYIHTRDMKVAVEYIKENYDGRYTVRTAKESKSDSNYTCTGTTSRRGTASHLRPTV